MSRISVVTGGTSGIGRGIVEKILSCSQEEDLIFVNYANNEKRAAEFVQSLPKEHQGKIRLFKADMSSYDAMISFVHYIKEEADHVDWLICNTGISTNAKYEDYTFEEWTKIVNTNLSVPTFLVKELRPVMRGGGSGLHIHRQADSDCRHCLFSTLCAESI